MKTFNITSFEQLEELYIQKLIDKVTSLKVNSIVWQEVYTNGKLTPEILSGETLFVHYP